MSTVSTTMIIEIQLYAILVKQFDIDISEIDSFISIRGDLRADPLKVTELMLALEDEFAVSIPKNTYKDIKNVHDIMEMLMLKV